MTVNLYYKKFLKQIKPIPEIIQNIISNIKTIKDLNYILTKTNNKGMKKYKKYHIKPIEIIPVPTHNIVFVIIETIETAFYCSSFKKYEILKIQFYIENFKISSSIYKDSEMGERLEYQKDQLNKIIREL